MQCSVQPHDLICALAFGFWMLCFFEVGEWWRRLKANEG
jgi:hypothetical protein